MLKPPDPSTAAQRQPPIQRFETYSLPRLRRPNRQHQELRLLSLTARGPAGLCANAGLATNTKQRSVVMHRMSSLDSIHGRRSCLVPLERPVGTGSNGPTHAPALRERWSKQRLRTSYGFCVRPGSWPLVIGVSITSRTLDTSHAAAARRKRLPRATARRRPCGCASGFRETEHAGRGDGLVEAVADLVGQALQKCNEGVFLIRGETTVEGCGPGRD